MIKDKIGKRFGELIVTQLEREHRKPSGASNPYWKCECSCGREVVVSGQVLGEKVRDNRASCGHELWKPLSIANTSAAYIAGLIDGEGCLGMAKVKTGYVPKLTIVMCESIAITECHAITGVGSIGFRPREQKHWKPCVYWQVGSSGLRRLLPTVKQYLLVKRRQADILTEYLVLSYSPPRRHPELNALYIEKIEALYQEIRRLNKRGI